MDFKQAIIENAWGGFNMDLWPASSSACNTSYRSSFHTVDDLSAEQTFFSTGTAYIGSEERKHPGKYETKRAFIKRIGTDAE